MIKQINGEHQISDYVAPASTAFEYNDVVTRDSSGQLALATATTPRSELLGLIQQDIASTDDDYASTKIVSVNEFHKEAEYEVAVDTGTLLSTMVGKRFDLADENGIDVTAEGQKCVQITRFITSAIARVKFITTGNKMRLVSYQQSVGVAEFTDGAGVSGTLDLGISIPAGAVFTRCLITGLVTFAGSSTATLTVGDGTTADRYNTGTPSVNATATAGVAMGAPSGTLFHSAAKTPKLTVAEDSDFTTCVTAGTGAFVITLFWYEEA